MIHQNEPIPPPSEDKGKTPAMLNGGMGNLDH